MGVSRLIFISIAVIFVQNDALDLSLLGPVKTIVQPLTKPLSSPLLDILPLHLAEVIKKLLTDVNPNNYPGLKASIEKYNNDTDDTRPQCCRPEQFPGLFTFLFDFFRWFEDLSIDVMKALCQILQIVTPLVCYNVLTGTPNGLLKVGCFIDSLLGPLFGELGELAGTLIVRILGRLDKIDGCLITGTAQIFNKFKYGKPNTAIGTAVGPATVGSVILAVAITTSYCLAEPLTSFMGDAYIVSWEEIVELCEEEVEDGYWDEIYFK